MKCIFVKADGQRCGRDFEGSSNYCETHRPASNPGGTLYTTKDKTWGGEVLNEVLNKEPFNSKKEF